MMTTVCDSGFFRRGMQISCAIHIFFIALVGMTIFAAQKEESAKEEYIFVNIEERQSSAAISATGAQPQMTEIVQQRQSSRPELSAAPSLPESRAAEGASVQALTGDSGIAVSSQGMSAAGDTAAATVLAGAYTETGAVETGGDEIDVAGIAARFAGIVESRKAYPYMALKRGETGHVAVFVRLNADGALAAAEVVESSGVKLLDEGALKAVRNACPYAHGAGQAVEFVVPIVYELKGR